MSLNPVSFKHEVLAADLRCRELLGGAGGPARSLWWRPGQPEDGLRGAALRGTHVEGPIVHSFGNTVTEEP